VRRGVAVTMAALLTLLPVMETAVAAGNSRAATTRVAAVAPVRLPLVVAPPAFTLVAAGAAASLSHDDAEVKVPVGAMAASGMLSIRPLAAREVARMNPGLINATRGPRRGYRMEPSGHFGGQVAITLPYDRKLLPEGMPERDLRIFWYDTAKKRWTPLQRASVNGRDQTVTGWTDHFTDFIAGVVNVPGHPQVEGFAPTELSSLNAADPGSKINLVQAPQANSSGDARVGYPIELPAGRNSLQPMLAIGYDSSRGNGWLGTGWDLAIPSVDIDTRWGVPRYDEGAISGTPLETETYMLNGAQLAPVANRGALVPRTAEKTFSLRVEDSFQKIVRHGDGPRNYWWEVTSRNGTRSLYGGSPTTGVDRQAVLSDPASPNGAIGRWLLREVIDANGNNITYHYNVVDLTFNGPEPARQIYPSSINYTGRTGGADGPYQVVFTRDSVRTDPIVDGRFGFKTVTTDRLTGIQVNLLTETSPLIRSYELDYKTGQFNKSLLTTIIQKGQDGTTEFNRHSFDYFDEVGSPTGITIFGGDVPVPGAGTTVGSGLVSGVNGTAFSGEANASDQTHLYTGVAVGVILTKEVSAGAKVGANIDNPQLSQILIDLNGDGRPDQVFLSGSGVFWRPNTGAPTAPSFGPAQPVPGLGAIDRSSGSTFTAGPEAFVGPASGLFDVSFGRSSGQVYFADVNGDGLPDLVSNGAVLFNRLDANGNPSFAPGSPTPLGSGAATNTAGLITPTPDQQAAAQQAFALVDSLRRWVAPFTGTVDITGQVALTQAGDSSADGVRAAIQLENTEIFSLTIADPTDLTPKPITGLTGIAVTAGQRLYFRVDSRNDGAFDTVSFDPTITYRTVNATAVDPTTLDENSLPLFATTASADYAYGGRALPVAVPAAGTATLSGTLAKPNVTSDEVRFTVTLNGTPVFTQVFAAGATGSVPVSVPLTLNQGDQLFARIDSDTRVNLSGITFAPTLTYQTVNGLPAPTAPDGTLLLTLEVPVTAQVYTVSTAPNPPAPFIAPGGQVEVTQTVSGTGPVGLNARVTLAAKSGGLLLAKQPVSIVNGVITGPSGLDAVFNLPAGTPVFFTVEATDPGVLTAFTISAPTTTGGDVLPFDVRVDTSATDPFGGGYRNWWFADYTPTDPTAPIDQTILRFPVNTGDPQHPDPVLQRFLGMLPFQAENRWDARSTNAFVSGALMGSTRLGARIADLPDGTTFGGGQGIVKTGSSQNTAGSISLLVFGVGTSNGTSGTDIDFFDFNGDGYPDVVGGGSLQATLPNGALDGRRIALGGPGQVRSSTVESDNISLGATTSSLRDTAQMFGLNIFSEQAPYNVGAGIDASHGTTTADFDLVDINGDGLPDFVQPAAGGLIVQLNLGYRFGQAETWTAPGGGTLRFERTKATGFNGSAGFTLPAYSFGGGISSTQSRAGTQQDLIDVNGDGLPDLVFKTLNDDITSTDTAILVALNTGAGFLAPQPWAGALPAPILSRSGVHRNLGLHFSISVGLGVGLIINPGFNHGDSFGGSESQIRDFDGDGYADHISSSGSAVTVHLNQRGRTNLLKSITRPLGASIALDYVRAGNTPNMPHNRWVMASRTVFDGLAGDGADFQIATFDYQNGRFDRAERTFYGFATVTEQERDTTGVTTASIGTTIPSSLLVLRSIIQTFRTDSFYTKGLLAQTITQTGAGARFLEMDNTYSVVTVPNGTGQSGLEDFTETRFPQLVRADKLFYEGQATAGEQTSETFAYDGFGNVIQYADLGDVGTADDVFATIGYTASSPACVTSYIVGIANSVTVTDTSGNVLRRRQADVDCTTANVTENRQFLADGSVAVTDMTYDGEGKLTTVTSPANLNGERYSLTYTYDNVVDVHVESVTDSFGYVSTSTHNFKFAEVLSATDENGQVTSSTYDNFGRLVSVTGPYEQGTGTATVDFSYSPFDTVPWALTSHVDSFRSATDRIETALFTDGLKRTVQTKKDAAVSPQTGTAPTDVMTVSGHVIFDPLGRTIQQFYPVTEPLGQQGVFNPAFDTVQPTVTTYDILDRPTRITIPDNTTSTSAYDFGADRNGQTRFRTTVIDANGVRKEKFSDVRSQITTVNELNNGGTAVFHTSYAYDPVRQLTSVTDDQGNVTSVAYDLLGRRIGIGSPDAGLTTFTYDLADNLIARQTANLRASGQQITYGYQFNRLTAINYPAFPANNVTYTYGAATQRQPGPVGNVVGRITHVTDGSGTEDRLYGPLGEIVQETRSVPIQGNQVLTYTTQFQYDTWNRIQSMVYPDQPNGEVVKYSYDSGGLVTHVQGNDDQLEVAYAARIDYDKFGKRLLLDIGNGVRTTYAYNPLNRRLANVQAALPNGGYTFHNFNFTYDPVGNLTQLQNNVLPPAKNSIGGPWTKTFNYDDLYQLTSSTGTHTIASGPTFTYSFGQSYNSIHNITHKTQTAMQNGAVNPQTTYDFAYSYPAPGAAHPHAATAIGGFTITNDANGNQVNTLGTGTSDQSEYLYDEENRLSCANMGPQAPSPSCAAQGNTQFIYDHSGVRRVKSKATPIIYPNQYYTDFGGGAGNQFKHIFIGNERLLTKKARVAPDRQHWYYHPDHMGSTGTVTNENGQMADAVHYFPYGEVWLEEVPASLPVDYFFTAKELDQETGFYDFGARYLDPRFSKWMTADPALGDYLSKRGTAGGIYAPQNGSLYAYGWNNPATLRDPNGSFVCGGLCIAGLIILGGAVFGGTWHVGSHVYVDRSLENVTVGGTLEASGEGALWAGAAIVQPELVAGAGLVLVGKSTVELADSAPRYFNGEMSTKEARQWEVGAFGVGLALLGPKGTRGGCSFAEETPVTTSDGLKPIGELKIGDHVLARDEKTGTYAFEPITQVFRDRDPVEAHLTLENPATGATEVIETTPNHSFHVPGRGFVEAAALKAGDPVSRALSNEPISTSEVAQLIADRSDMSDVLRVKTLTFENQPFWAYNLEVAEDHTYFVGAERAWVHNGKGPCGIEGLEGLEPFTFPKPQIPAAIEEQLAAAEGNLVPKVTANGTVAANAAGQRTHSGFADKPGFLPGSQLTAQVMALGQKMNFPFRNGGPARDRGIPGQSAASHAETQMSFVSDVFAVSKEMCDYTCRPFVSARAVAEGRTFYVMDPTKIWIFTPTSTSWIPRPQ
jgi:RHS repeat-associated protein